MDYTAHFVQSTSKILSVANVRHFVQIKTPTKAGRFYLTKWVPTGI